MFLVSFVLYGLATWEMVSVSRLRENLSVAVATTAGTCSFIVMMLVADTKDWYMGIPVVLGNALSTKLVIYLERKYGTKE